MKWDCICFDLDNTLCDYEGAFEAGMRANYRYFSQSDWKEYELPSVDEWFPIYKSLCDDYWYKVEEKSISKKEYQRKRLVDALRKFGVDISNESADQFQHRFYERVDKHVTLYEGVEELLDELQVHGTKLGIISNGRVPIQQRKIERLALSKWFSTDSIFISEDVGAAKPAPEIFQYAEMKLSATHEQKLFVGDSWELDVIGAINAGWDALHLNTRHEAHASEVLSIVVCETITGVSEHILSR